MAARAIEAAGSPPRVPVEPISIVALRRESVTLALAAGALAEASEVVAWLSDRAEVRELALERMPTATADGALEIRFVDGPRSAGAFVRSLRDRIAAAARTPERSLEVQILHLLEGRVRLRVAGVSDDDVLRLGELSRSLPGVVHVNASPASRSLLVSFDPTVTSAREILDAIARGDREAWPSSPLRPERHETAKTLFNTAVLAAAVSGVLPVAPMGAAVALTAFPAVRRAVRALGERRLSVDLLDVAAVGIAVGTGAPATGAFITWLLGVGDMILERTADNARGAIAKVLKLDTESAWLVTDGEAKKVSAKSLKIGDRIVVSAGDSIAADGVVVSGQAQVDEKALTGESVPRERHVGDRVLAATVVVDGELHVEVDRVGRDTTAAKIVQILEGAGAKPMTLQRDTERIADRLVVPTLGVAGAAGAFGSGIDAATSVLITDFGTGIRIAVPTATLTAITLAARDGLLVKGAQYLERLSKVDTIVFDKTGTLTSGTPEIFEVVPVGAFTIAEVMRFAAAAEARQRHPVAEAIRAWVARARLEVPSDELGSSVYTVGMGVRARVEGHEVVVGGARMLRNRGARMSVIAKALNAHEQAGASSVIVSIDDELAGVIGFADQPRRESRAVVDALKAGGRRQIVLMSGDARLPVEAVARAVGADRAHWELLPEDKASRVRALQAEGRVVAMVGDGINDAPALALADVGISLEGGTDVALETADVVLLEGGLCKLPDAFEVADDSMRRVRRALGLVVAPNAVAIALGALGILPPTIAALINNGSTVAAALAGVAPLLGRMKPRRNG